MSGGTVVNPPVSGGTVTLQDIEDFFYKLPLQTTGNVGFGTHPAPLEIKNTGVDWRTVSGGFGPTPYVVGTSGTYAGYNFKFHNVWWQLGRAAGYTDAAILQCQVEMECPQVWHRKNAVWAIAKTNQTPALDIDGSAAVLGTPGGGYWKTRDADGTNNFALVTSLTSSTRAAFSAGSDANGTYGDGHRIELSGIVDADGSPRENGEAELLHTFYSNAFFPRLPYPRNADNTNGEVLIFSRARLVGPAGVDLRKVAALCALSGDLYEDSTQSSVTTTPGGFSKNPGIGNPVHRWLVDPNAAAPVYQTGPWVPMGGLFQVSKANIGVIHSESPIPVVTS